MNKKIVLTLDLCVCSSLSLLLTTNWKLEIQFNVIQLHIFSLFFFWLALCICAYVCKFMCLCECKAHVFSRCSRTYLSLSVFFFFFWKNIVGLCYRCKFAFNRHIAVFFTPYVEFICIYLKLHSTRSLHFFTLCCSAFDFEFGSVCFVAFFLHPFHKFPMLITACFTPNQY